jgi:hypothetical protein
MSKTNEPVKPISFKIEGQKVIIIQNVQGNLTIGEKEAFSLAVDFLDILSLKDAQDRHRLLLAYLAQYTSDSSPLPLEMKKKAASLYLQLSTLNQSQTEQLFDSRQTKKTKALVQRLGWFMAGSLSSFGVTVLFDNSFYDDDDDDDDDGGSKNVENAGNTAASSYASTSGVTLNTSFEKRQEAETYHQLHSSIYTGTGVDTKNEMYSSNSFSASYKPGEPSQGFSNESIKPPLRHELNFGSSSDLDISNSILNASGNDLTSLNDAAQVLRVAKKTAVFAHRSNNIANHINSVVQLADHANTVAQNADHINSVVQVADHANTVAQAADHVKSLSDTVGH